MSPGFILFLSFANLDIWNMFQVLTLMETLFNSRINFNETLCYDKYNLLIGCIPFGEFIA